MKRLLVGIILVLASAPVANAQQCCKDNATAIAAVKTEVAALKQQVAALEAQIVKLTTEIERQKNQQIAVDLSDCTFIGKPNWIDPRNGEGRSECGAGQVLRGVHTGVNVPDAEWRYYCCTLKVAKQP